MGLLAKIKLLGEGKMTEKEYHATNITTVMI